MFKLLLVDDDTQALESTRKMLEIGGYAVTTACNGQDGLEKFRAASASSNSFDLVVTDVRMPKLGGLEFLKALSVGGESVPVILMTAFGRIEDAVWAMKLGAVDFLSKPFKRQALLSAAETALRRTKIKDRTAARASDNHSLLGVSAAMEKLRGMITQVASSSATILITGESGTGKELVAKSIHAQSLRAQAPFIAINVAAVPEGLLESELFGYEKGAFTGAVSAKAGLFEAAQGGTLLLDEIGDMPIQLQVKLLRTLQEGEVRRLGSTVSKKIDVRVIAATHRDLKAHVQAGSFREDLLFRLEVIGLPIPPLRQRMEDLAVLATHFLEVISTRHYKVITHFSDEAMQILKAHTWPGNIRELCNVIERAVVFAGSDEIQSSDLPAHLADLAGGAAAGNSGTISVRLGTSLKDVEDLLIRKTLEATSGDKNMTAKILGINSRTIYRKLDKGL